MIRRKQIRILLGILVLIVYFFSGMVAYGAQEKENKGERVEEIPSLSYVLMEKTTGAVICERKPDLELMPASITKIMTLILIFEALEDNKISMEDIVQVSEHASAMGGSQVYLEEGETQTVKDMIKCIVIASANDACVAMAEYIAGSEENFVKKMNQKAAELSMKNTVFSNCCGLDDSLSEKQHHSTAYDIALMSRELLLHHEEVKEFTTIWMDKIVHVTRKGEKEFGLTNTNKLVRTYQGITGLKTGSTSKAKFCLSASANRNGVEFIAVVMGAPTPKDRFQDASKLLDYGFANCQVYEDKQVIKKGEKREVKKGKKQSVTVKKEKTFYYVCKNGESKEKISKKLIWNLPLQAPVKKGEQVGLVQYYSGKKKIGEVAILAEETIQKANYLDYLLEQWNVFFDISYYK